MSNTKRTFVVGEHFDQFISERLAKGRYNNASEIVRAGLRMLESHEAQLESLRSQIALGDEDVAKGNTQTFGSAQELFDDIISEAR